MSSAPARAVPEPALGSVEGRMIIVQLINLTNLLEHQRNIMSPQVRRRTYAAAPAEVNQAMLLISVYLAPIYLPPQTISLAPCVLVLVSNIVVFNSFFLSSRPSVCPRKSPSASFSRPLDLSTSLPCP